MAIEDTFGYRFVRISLILLNCLVLVRLVSLLLQYSPFLEPTHVLIILLIGSNFMSAIIGTIREHRIAVLITGSLTLIMFLSLLFTHKDNKNLNVSLFTLLAIAAHSLIFSEMLKEKQLFSNQRRNLDLLGQLSNTTSSNSSRRATSNHAPLTAVVVYQPPGTNQGQSGGIFMVDPLIGADLPKDPPPSYFAGSCPPPKYEDAIKLSGSNFILPTFNATTSTATTTETNIDTGTTSNNNINDNNNNINDNNNNTENQVEQISQNSTSDHIPSSSSASSDNNNNNANVNTQSTSQSTDNNNNTVDDKNNNSNQQ